MATPNRSDTVTETNQDPMAFEIESSAKTMYQSSSHPETLRVYQKNIRPRYISMILAAQSWVSVTVRMDPVRNRNHPSPRDCAMTGLGSRIIQDSDPTHSRHTIGTHGVRAWFCFARFDIHRGSGLQDETRIHPWIPTEPTPTFGGALEALNAPAASISTLQDSIRGIWLAAEPSEHLRKEHGVWSFHATAPPGLPAVPRAVSPAAYPRARSP